MSGVPSPLILFWVKRKAPTSACRLHACVRAAFMCDFTETLGGVPDDDMWAFVNDDDLNLGTYSLTAPLCQPTLRGDQGVVASATAPTATAPTATAPTATAAALTAAANLKTATAERPRFDIVCPKNGCNISNDTLDKLSGTGQSRRGYYCSPARGGCGERWSQRIYKDDEVSHLPNLGTHNPHIKKTKKLSPRERKMKKQQMLRALEDEVCTVVGQTVPASDYSDMQCAGDGCARSFSGTNPNLEATQCTECQRWFCKIDCSDAYSFGLQWMCNGCIACLG